MGALLKTVLLRTAGFSLWIALSAWLFSLVEYTQTNDGVEKYKSLLSLYVSMKSKYNMTAEEFDNFTKEAHEALIAPKPQWTYPASFDFVFQALTTIGYGNITPQTPSGQVLCIFVCFFGIPITLLTLNSIGELIAKGVNIIVTKVEKKGSETHYPDFKRAKNLNESCVGETQDGDVIIDAALEMTGGISGTLKEILEKLKELNTIESSVGKS